MSQQQSTDVAQKFEDAYIACVFDDPISTLDRVPVDNVSVKQKSNACALRDDEMSVFDSVRFC